MKEIIFEPSYRIDNPLIPSQKAYEVLDNFLVYKHKNIDDLSQAEFLDREALKDIYKALQDSRHKLVNLLSDFESQGIISSNDKLFASCLFLISEKIGPDLESISSLISEHKINIDFVQKELNRVELPVNSKEALREIIYKINNYYHNLSIRERL